MLFFLNHIVYLDVIHIGSSCADKNRRLDMTKNNARKSSIAQMLFPSEIYLESVPTYHSASNSLLTSTTFFSLSLFSVTQHGIRILTMRHRN